jgi:hypothetical protein
MAGQQVRKRPIEMLEGAEASSERLASPHHPDGGLQPSTGMEILDRISPDSVLHFEGVSNLLLAPYRREAGGPRLLNVNHFIQEVVQSLRRIVEKRVRLQAVLADRDMRVVADREEMSRVFATIVAYGSGIIQRGGTITILARLLPIKYDLLGKGGGRCALLSVSSTDVVTHGSGPDRDRRGRAGKGAQGAYSAIRSVIGRYNGSVRILRQEGTAQFNIYLPVLQGV